MDTAKERGEIQHRSMRNRIDIQHRTVQPNFSVTGPVTERKNL